jgi:hypothetical protein
VITHWWVDGVRLANHDSRPRGTHWPTLLAVVCILPAVIAVPTAKDRAGLTKPEVALDAQDVAVFVRLVEANTRVGGPGFAWAWRSSEFDALRALEGAENAWLSRWSRTEDVTTFVASGDFVGRTAHHGPGGEPPRGSVLLAVVGKPAHRVPAVRLWGIQHERPDLAGLGDPTTITLDD